MARDNHFPIEGRYTLYPLVVSSVQTMTTVGHETQTLGPEHHTVPEGWRLTSQYLDTYVAYLAASSTNLAAILHKTPCTEPEDCAVHPLHFPVCSLVTLGGPLRFFAKEIFAVV
ncbi:uncharacterized protein PHALS_06249 [Plasmopara halstedii]|uniref:Uncharacterized protein n=1 Tax=Plasmopara halstedii TaxID=4781 RepID=A0A0P1B2D6_PLAHL|nr:uncharacterized protein PHALS_06249 [Plasmopara halstedii]CEG48425.1 hypothetical protein PHALS_06249 [Plasmopara halstedii]|eukprot:XP_024584794.1 hypothetical protein PHALS_06249 [Plasmopara halstedii]